MTWANCFFVFAKRTIITGSVGYSFCNLVGYVAQVDGASMKPTLNGFSKSKSQDWVFVNTLAYQTEPLQRGDIVVFISHKGKFCFLKKFREIVF